VRKDFEVTEAELKSRNVLFVGRPETNQALAAWSEKLGLKYEGAIFIVDGQRHSSEYEALAAAYPNPLNSDKMVLVLAGNAPLETARLASYDPGDGVYQVLKDGKPLKTPHGAN
jgi:hypothetical protein